MTAYTFSQLFDFTRTTAGTFVGSNGLIQNTPASVNLLLYTQDFDIATWNKGGGSVTVTANSATAPDGTSTADTVTESVGGTTHNIYQAATVVSGSAYTWSGYVKANGRSIVQITCQATAVLYVVEFDLTTVTTTNRSGSGSATITAVGNGWYRIVATATSTGAGTGYWQINLCSAANTTNYSGNGTSGIFLWGAQLELGSSATTYTKNVGGLFPARFEYDPVTLLPRGLLVEEQRTNLVLQSQTFDNAAWPKNGITVSANAGTSPDGSSNAEAITENTANTSHQLFQNVSFTSGVAYTASVYVKQSVGTRRLNIALGSAPFGIELYATYNLSTLAITVSAGVTATIENVGNGWYRCRMTATATATASDGFIFRLANSDAATFFSYTGDGTSTLLLYGAQMEAGTFATSYIPTVASQVTRSPDICNITAPMFAPWYNQSVGTLVADIQKLSPSTVATYGYELLGATSSFSMRVRVGTDGRMQSVDGGVTQVDTQIQAAALSTPSKYAVAYAANDYAGSANGGTVGTDTSATVPAISSLALGSAAVTNLYIRSIRYYPLRASNTQLQALST